MWCGAVWPWKGGEEGRGVEEGVRAGRGGVRWEETTRRGRASFGQPLPTFPLLSPRLAIILFLFFFCPPDLVSSSVRRRVHFVLPPRASRRGCGAAAAAGSSSNNTFRGLSLSRLAAAIYYYGGRRGSCCAVHYYYYVGRTPAALNQSHTRGSRIAFRRRLLKVVVVIYKKKTVKHLNHSPTTCLTSYYELT